MEKEEEQASEQLNTSCELTNQTLPNGLTMPGDTWCTLHHLEMTPATPGSDLAYGTLRWGHLAHLRHLETPACTIWGD